MSNEDKLAERVKHPQQKVVYSTTEGRQKFPDILQTSFGEKAVIGFGRYGRAIGAVVPMEAVRMLAGHHDNVDEDVISRIRRTAEQLLQQMPSEAALLPEPKGGSLEEDLANVERGRKKRPAVAPAGSKGSRLEQPE